MLNQYVCFSYQYLLVFFNCFRSSYFKASILVYFVFKSSNILENSFGILVYKYISIIDLILLAS